MCKTYPWDNNMTKMHVWCRDAGRIVIVRMASWRPLKYIEIWYQQTIARCPVGMHLPYKCVWCHRMILTMMTEISNFGPGQVPVIIVWHHRECWHLWYVMISHTLSDILWHRSHHRHLQRRNTFVVWFFYQSQLLDNEVVKCINPTCPILKLDEKRLYMCWATNPKVEICLFA